MATRRKRSFGSRTRGGCWKHGAPEMRPEIHRRRRRFGTWRGFSCLLEHLCKERFLLEFFGWKEVILLPGHSTFRKKIKFTSHLAAS